MSGARLRVGLGLTLAGLAAGCGASPLAAVAVSPVPSGNPAVAGACARLLDALPEKVDDLRRRQVDPPGAGAAWGKDVVVVLRCGVAKPKALTLTSQLAGVNDVDWFPEQRDGARVFTTVGRVANVEITIPAAHEPQPGPLVDVAAAMTSTNPMLESQAVVISGASRDWSASVTRPEAAKIQRRPRLRARAVRRRRSTSSG